MARSLLNGSLADGMTVDEILEAYPDLEREDVQEALRYAAEAVRERKLPLTTSRAGLSSTTLSSH